MFPVCLSAREHISLGANQATKRVILVALLEVVSNETLAIEGFAWDRLHVKLRQGSLEVCLRERVDSSS